jgi:hypothetical protein
MHGDAPTRASNNRACKQHGRAHLPKGDSEADGTDRADLSLQLSLRRRLWHDELKASRSCRRLQDLHIGKPYA